MKFQTQETPFDSIWYTSRSLSDSSDARGCSRIFQNHSWSNIGDVTLRCTSPGEALCASRTSVARQAELVPLHVGLADQRQASELAEEDLLAIILINQFIIDLIQSDTEGCFGHLQFRSSPCKAVLSPEELSRCLLLTGHIWSSTFETMQTFHWRISNKEP